MPGGGGGTPGKPGGGGGRLDMVVARINSSDFEIMNTSYVIHVLVTGICDILSQNHSQLKDGRSSFKLQEASIIIIRVESYTQRVILIRLLVTLYEYRPHTQSNE